MASWKAEDPEAGRHPDSADGGDEAGWEGRIEAALGRDVVGWTESESGPSCYHHGRRGVSHSQAGRAEAVAASYLEEVNATVDAAGCCENAKGSADP